MKWLIVPASAAVVAAPPAAADAKPPTPAHAHAYERAYRQVVHLLGRRAPGRNIIKDGFAANRAATDTQTVASLAGLERMVAPAPSSPAVSTGGGTGTGGLPACASESGTNYSTGSDNTNGSSGATGRYQITPSTAANYGCNLGTSSEQDACAQTIYEHQGAGASVGCGG